MGVDLNSTKGTLFVCNQTPFKQLNTVIKFDNNLVPKSELLKKSRDFFSFRSLSSF